MTDRSELVRRVRDVPAVDVSALCPTPGCGLTTVRVDDFYRPSPGPGETDAFDPISGVCLGCRVRVYFTGPVPWSRVTLVDDPLDPTDPTNPTPSAKGRDDEPDIPE